MPDFVTIARLEDVPEGTVKTFFAGETHLALANVGGEIFAVQDVCTHDGGPLGEGELVEGEVECPRHGARFDIRTGRVTAFPAVVGIRTFPVRVEGAEGVLRLDCDRASPPRARERDWRSDTRYRPLLDCRQHAATGETANRPLGIGDRDAN